VVYDFGSTHPDIARLLRRSDEMQDRSRALRDGSVTASRELAMILKECDRCFRLRPAFRFGHRSRAAAR
jgi:hypothetical protein